MCKHGVSSSFPLNHRNCYFIIIIVALGGGFAKNSQSIDDQKFIRGDSGEFKLTKLLNIEMGGEPEKQMNTDLRNAILTEVKRGIRNELDFPEHESLEPMHSPLESYSQKDLVAILHQIYSEASTLKRNMSDLVDYTRSDCLIQTNIADGKSYPVGVNFYQMCHQNALNKETTGPKKYFPRSCKEVQEQGNNISGVYQIQPKKSEKPFFVLCDMNTKGGGWTHIQKRYDGSVDFFLGWREYKFGFGDLESEFWLGLENIYKMTGFEINELLVEIVDRENKSAYAHYSAFGVGSEAEGYPLSTLKGFSGDAGDSLTQHLGSKFSTKDFDQDQGSRHCAEAFSGAWWYKDCHVSNLNGKYRNAVLPEQYKYKGMHWTSFRNNEYSHAKSRMMVRPVG